MQPEAHIAGVGTAVPYPIGTERLIAHDRRIREAHGQPEATIAQFERFVRGTGVHTRHYAHPHWLPEGARPEDQPGRLTGGLERDIFTPADFAPAHWERMTVFRETAEPMALAAARAALADWGGRAEEIGMVITTCTSGWSEPGLAVAAIRELGLSLDTQKAELNFNGCFCGATCLRMARDAVRAGSARHVLVIACEVASTHYDVNATDVSSLVAHSLFADGAAAMIVGVDGPWRYRRAGMSLAPESEHLLGLVPPMRADHLGYRMTLDRRVGRTLGRYFAEGRGGELLDRLVAEAGGGDLPALGVHPGGPNILDHLAGALGGRGWGAEALAGSYDVMRGHGNLGAAAMLFVLARRLKEAEEDEMLTLAFGPGVTVEWASLARAA